MLQRISENRNREDGQIQGSCQRAEHFFWIVRVTLKPVIIAEFRDLKKRPVQLDMRVTNLDHPDNYNC